MTESSPSSERPRYASARDEALYLICRDGWANRSNGNQASEHGYFWLINNAPEEIPEIADAFSLELEEAHLYDRAALIGSFVVIEDAAEKVTVFEFDNPNDAEADYMARVTAYGQWLQEQRP